VATSIGQHSTRLCSGVERVTAQMYDDVFKPEIDEPVKTLEITNWWFCFPINALGLLIEFLSIAGTRQHGVKSIEQYPEDPTGSGTVEVPEKYL